MWDKVSGYVEYEVCGKMLCGICEFIKIVKKVRRDEKPSYGHAEPVGTLVKTVSYDSFSFHFLLVLTFH